MKSLTAGIRGCKSRALQSTIRVGKCFTTLGCRYGFPHTWFYLWSHTWAMWTPYSGIFHAPKEFYPSLINWIKEHHQWEVKRQWVGFLPGIVPGLSFAVQSLTKPGDEVIVQPPVYYPFFHVVENNKRVVINNPVKTLNGKFEMDLEDLERKITPKTKLFILCNPHNPVVAFGIKKR